MSFGTIYLKKCNRKSKFCYIFTGIFKTHIKTEDFYKDIEKILLHQITKIINDAHQWEKTQKLLG